MPATTSGERRNLRQGCGPPAGDKIDHQAADPRVAGMAAEIKAPARLGTARG